LQCVAEMKISWRMFQDVRATVSCRVLQCVVMCFSEFQFVALCCGMLQSVAEMKMSWRKSKMCAQL